MERIIQWLESKDYDQGVELYLEFGSDQNLIDLFTLESWSQYKQDRLEKELRLLLKDKPTIKPPDLPERPFRPAVVWPEEETDTYLQSLRKDAMLKFKEMKDLHAQLMLMKDDQKRGEAAHRILDLDDEFTELMEKRDYYKQHGKLPDVEPEEPVTDPIKIAQIMQNLTRYIRRERQALDKDPANSSAAGRLTKFVNQYNQYAERFGRDLLPTTGADQ